jgi:hypothetical protein
MAVHAFRARLDDRATSDDPRASHRAMEFALGLSLGSAFERTD